MPSGTMVETPSRINHDYELISLACLSAGTAFDSATSAIYGDVRMITVVPGSPAPTSSATLTFLDADGIDIMGGSVICTLGQYFPKISTGVYRDFRRVASALEVVIGSNSQSGAVFTVNILIQLPKNLFQ